MQSPMENEETSPMFRDVYETDFQYPQSSVLTNGSTLSSNGSLAQSQSEPFSPRRPSYPATLSRLPAFLRKSESQPFYTSTRPAPLNPGPSFLEQAQAASSAHPIPVYASTSNQPYAHYDPSYQAQIQQQQQLQYQQQLQQQYDFATPQKSRLPSATTSKQLESLESLLSRAGYKDTRVFTPEAEKMKERRLAAAMGLGGGGLMPGIGQENEVVGRGQGSTHGSTSHAQGRKSSAAQQSKTTTSTLPLHPSLPPKPVGRAISTQDMRRGASGRGGGRAGRGGGGNRNNTQALGNNRGQAQNGNNQHAGYMQPQPVQPHKAVRKIPSAYFMDEGSHERAVDFGTFFQHPVVPAPFALPPFQPSFTATAAPFVPQHPYVPPPVMFSSPVPVIATSGYSAAFDAMYSEPAVPVMAPLQIAESATGSEVGSGEGSVIGVVGMTESGTPVTGRKRKVLNRVEIETAQVEAPPARLFQPPQPDNHADHSWASMEDDEDDADFDVGASEWWRRDLGEVVAPPTMARAISAEEVEQVEQGLAAGDESFSPGQSKVKIQVTSEATEETRFDPAAYEASTPEDAEADFEGISETGSDTEQDDIYGASIDSTAAQSMTSSNAHTEMMAYLVDQDAEPMSSASAGLAESSVIATEPAQSEAEVVLEASPPRPTARAPDWPVSPPRHARIASPPRVSHVAPAIQFSVDQDAAETQQTYTRQLRHAMSTPLFEKEASGPTFSNHEKRIRETGWGSGIGLGLGNPTGWLKSIGRSWSGGSASSKTSQETVKSTATGGIALDANGTSILKTQDAAIVTPAAIIVKPRAPKAMKSMGNLRRRPASPRLDKTARIVCDSTQPDELPPIDITAPVFAHAMSRRPLRAKLSLQALTGSAMAASEPESSKSPVLSPRADWHDSFWGTPAQAQPAPVGFNAMMQTPGKKAYYRPTNESISLGGYPDFSQSFFYNPPTPPKPAGSEASGSRSKPDRMVKKQQSIKSLRAHLLKGVVSAKQATPATSKDVPPVPALPDAFKHMQGLAKTPPKTIQAFPPPPVLAISSPGMCDAGLPPRELVLEGEEWEGASSYESAKQRERSMKKGKSKAKRSSSLKRERA